MGRKNNLQGISSEHLVAERLRSNGWTVIPTSGSRSAIDLLAFHRRRRLWWGVQVKSSNSPKTFDTERLIELCTDLYMTPILVIVGREKKRRFIGLCMIKGSRYYHMEEDGTVYHPLAADWVCEIFKPKIGVLF